MKRSGWLRLGVACGVLTLATHASGAETLNFTRLTSWPGYPMGSVMGLYATGSTLWLGIECFHNASIGALMALDVRDPAAPVVLSSTPTGAGSAWAFDKGFAYGLTPLSSPASTRYLEVYDLADVRQPVLRGRTSMTAGWIQSLVTHQGYVWAFSATGVETYDVRIPSAPQWAGSLAWPESESQVLSSMVLCNGFGVVMSRPSSSPEPYALRVLDLSNPVTPTQIGSMSVNMGEYSWMVLTAVGDVVYYLTGNRPGSAYQIHLKAVRITTSGTIEPTAVDLVLGEVVTYTMWPVGNYLYFSTPERDVKCHLRIIDVSQQLQPRALPSTSITVASDIFRAADSGGRIFVSAGGGGGAGSVAEIDTTDPAAPVSLGTVWESWHPSGLMSGGGFGLVGGSQEPIWHVKDLGTSRIRWFGAAGLLQGNPAPYRDWNLAFDPEWNHVLLHGNYCYALSLKGSWSFTGQLDVFDVSGSGRPVQLQSLQVMQEDGDWGCLPSYIYHTAKIDGDQLYLGYDPGKLDIYSLTTPASPQFLSQVSIGRPRDVEVHDGYAYVLSAPVCGGAAISLEVVDVRDPASPSVATTFHQYTGAYQGTMAVDGGRLYVVYFKSSYPVTQTLDVFSLTNPLSPARLSSTPVAQVAQDSFHDLAILKQYAILTGPKLVVADISDPLRPKAAGTYDPFPQLQNYYIAPYDKVTTWQNHVVVQNECTGIEILDLGQIEAHLRLSNPAYSPLNGFSFILRDGIVGRSYRIQRSSSVRGGSWVDWQSITYTEPMGLTDVGATTGERRFYRAVSP